MNLCYYFFRTVGDSKLALKSNLPIKTELSRAISESTLPVSLAAPSCPLSPFFRVVPALGRVYWAYFHTKQSPNGQISIKVFRISIRGGLG